MIKARDDRQPDVMKMLVEYIEGIKELPNNLDMYLVLNLALCCHDLKLKQMEKDYIKKYLFVMVDRDNILTVFKVAHNQSTLPEVLDYQGNEDDEQEEESPWMDLLSFCVEICAINLKYILSKYYDLFLQTFSNESLMIK